MSAVRLLVRPAVEAGKGTRRHGDPPRHRLDRRRRRRPLRRRPAAVDRRLAAALSNAGITAASGTTLDIVAHSMGGLVSRWMIERVPSSPPVARLVTAGTPNGGSPWTTWQNWATVVLTLGLNRQRACGPRRAQPCPGDPSTRRVRSPHLLQQARRQPGPAIGAGQPSEPECLSRRPTWSVRRWWRSGSVPREFT